MGGGHLARRRRRRTTVGLADRHRQHLADVLSAEGVLQHRRLEPLPLALLARGFDGGHDAQFGVDDAGAVAGRARTLGVGAEQAGLHAVGLRERLADRVEQAGVGRRVAASRTADRALVDHDHAVAARDRAVDQRALAGAGDARDHAEHAERDVDVHVSEVVRRRAADLQRAGGRAYRSLEARPVVEMAAGDGVTLPQPLHGALETDGAALRPGTGPEVDHMVGDRDRLGFVLHDEHRVALVAQLQQQVVHALDVMRMQSDRGLVEDVRDVGERRAEVTDHLGAL